jgi:hypothetical protein
MLVSRVLSTAVGELLKDYGHAEAVEVPVVSPEFF